MQYLLKFLHWMGQNQIFLTKDWAYFDICVYSQVRCNINCQKIDWKIIIRKVWACRRCWIIIENFQLWHILSQKIRFFDTNHNLCRIENHGDSVSFDENVSEVSKNHLQLRDTIHFSKRCYTFSCKVLSTIPRQAVSAKHLKNISWNRTLTHSTAVSCKLMQNIQITVVRFLLLAIL